MPNRSSLRRGKSTTSSSRTQKRTANAHARKSATAASRSTQSAVGRQGRSVTFDSNHTTSGAQARGHRAAPNVLAFNSQDAPINEGNDDDDDDDDDDEGVQDDDEDDEDDEDGNEDVAAQHSSELVGYGQPIDLYGERRAPTSDIPVDQSNADIDGADDTLSPSFVGSATQTAMSYPAGRSRGPVLPNWHGGNPPGSSRRRTIENSEELPASSPIVSSMERAAKRRRIDEDGGRDNNDANVDQGRDVMGARRNAAHRALPDVRALNEAARRLQTPVRPAAGSRAVTHTPGPRGFNPVTANNRRHHRGDEGRSAPAYQLGHYTPFSKTFLREGKAFYKNKVIMENAFPLGDLRMDQGKAAWEYAIRTRPEAYASASLKTFTPHVLRLFGDTAWAFRGAVKTETKRIVLSEYALTPPNTLGASTAGPAGPLAFTQTRVKYLLDDNRFLYGLFHDRSDIPFTHMALCMIIERTVFVGLSPEMRNVLNPMPASLVALAAAAIVNGLHEWSDGYHKKKAFKEETYGPIYRYFLKKLCEFEKERPNRFKMLMASYFTFCTVTTQPEHDERTEESDEDDWAVCGSESEDDELIMAD